MAEREDLEAKSYQEKTQDKKVLHIFWKQKVKHMSLKSSETNKWREAVNG